MKYYIYHIPGKKIGVTTNLKSRVEDQQGYEEAGDEQQDDGTWDLNQASGGIVDTLQV